MSKKTTGNDIFALGEIRGVSSKMHVFKHYVNRELIQVPVLNMYMAAYSKDHRTGMTVKLQIGNHNIAVFPTPDMPFFRWERNGKTLMERFSGTSFVRGMRVGLAGRQFIRDDGGTVVYAHMIVPSSALRGDQDTASLFPSRLMSSAAAHLLSLDEDSNFGAELLFIGDESLTISALTAKSREARVAEYKS